MSRRPIPDKIHLIAYGQCEGDPDWYAFITPVMNIAEFDLPAGLRMGQAIMNALGERNNFFFEQITNTEFDIWELDELDWPRFEAFFQKLFEMFVEAL